MAVAYLGTNQIGGGGGGSIDNIVMNGDVVTVTGGVADLGTVITQHQDISGKADKVSNSTNGNFAGLDANGNLTDSGHKHSDYQAALVSGTNIKTVNSTSLLGSGNVSVGTYSKPSGGIPKTDLASAVQTSLGKADTALQSYTETDPVFSAAPAASIQSTDISAWNAKLSGVTFNGVAATVTGGVAAITATIPAAPGTLQTNLSTAQSTSASEALSGSVKLHKIAKTGTYSDLIGTPTIPTKVSDLTNDAGYTTNTGTVTRVDVGTSQYSPTSGIVSLPAYPTTLPASDVSAWAKESSKPSYTLDEVSDGSTRKLSNYQPVDADLTAIAGLSGTSGLLKKTAANTWSLDTNTYYYSGNANKSDVAWTCSNLSASGTITVANNAEQQDHLVLHNSKSAGASAGGRFVTLRMRGYYDYRYSFIRTGFTNYAIPSNINFGFNSTSGGPETTAMSIDSSGNVVASGTITPGSDSRIKENQIDISQEDAFFVIEHLKPKTWIWDKKYNKEKGGKSAAGLVAQDVKEVLPDAVTISENGDIKDFHSLNYNTIQGYEIAAIKGLIEEVKSLKAEIAELKKQIK